MEITKHGVIPNDRIWHGTCMECKSEANATEIEMTHIVNDFQKESGSFSWEKCPVCGAGNAKGYGGMLFYPVSVA